jgi:glycerophosphoryl diester phosphodiesterase
MLRRILILFFNRTVVQISIIFCTIFASCDKIYYYPDKTNILTIQTKVIAHRGGGDKFGPENSLTAIKGGINLMDGIEVDIQLSQNATIWLGHDYLLPSCGNYKSTCFRETTDNQIKELDSCLNHEFQYTRLEEVFKYMADSCPGKFISIDVKAWHPCDVQNLDIVGEMNVIADGIIMLKKKYNLNTIMVESETASFLNYIKDHSTGIECYLTTLGDFERGMLIALKRRLVGLSFAYKMDEEITLDHVKMIRRKGLKIQLWTVNDPKILEEAYSINPDFIQTDNLDSAKKKSLNW